MSVGASLFAHLTGNNPLAAYAQGAQIRTAFDTANQNAMAQGFNYLLANMKMLQEGRQHQDTLQLGYARLQEETRLHDAQIALDKARGDALNVTPPTLGGSGDLGGGTPPPMSTVPATEAPAAPLAIPPGGPGTMPPISPGVSDSLTQQTQAMRDRLSQLTGGQSPLDVINDPEADPTHRDLAFSVLNQEKQTRDLAVGADPQSHYWERPPGAPLPPDYPPGNGPPMAAAPALTAAPATATGNQGQLLSPVIPGSAMRAPDGSTLGRPTGLVPDNPLFSGIPATGAPGAKTSTTAGGKSTDPADWSNIKEGGQGYKAVSADGKRAIIRRKSGGVMIEQLQTLEQNANGRWYQKDWPEKVVVPDALSRKPMEVQLPQDKIDAFNTAKYWLTKIYPGMDVKDKAANRDQAMGMNALMVQLGNDPQVQTELRKVNAADMVAPPGMVISGSHYDPKSERQVFSFRKLQPGEAENTKELRAQVRDAWATYTKLSTASHDLYGSQRDAMRAKAADALNYVMRLDPVFAATQAAGGGGVPADSTSAKVDKLLQIMGTK